MYYGGDSFGMDDLAQTEMGGFSGMGDNSPTQTPIVQSGDFAQIGKTAQDLSTIYANFLLAKNQICPPGQSKGANGQCMCPPGTIQTTAGGPCVPIPMGGGQAPGMSPTTKMLIALGVGAAAIGGLVWVMKRKKGRNGGGVKLDDGWRTIGE
jgi:hypothetical protein